MKRIVVLILGVLMVVSLTLPMAVLVYAADVGISKGVTPPAPNQYQLGDTIHYTMSITNFSDITGANEDVVVTAVSDVLPDGSTVYPTGPALPYTLSPGQTQSYTYDWVATVTGWVTNTFHVSGYQISGGGNDPFESWVQKLSLVIDPSINVEKYVWDGGGWQDADAATGPYLPSTQNPVIFAFEIENDGDVDLTNVTLTDTDMSSFYTNQACTIPAIFPFPALVTSASLTVYGKLSWAEGQHSNNAIVTGTPPVGPSVSDSDPAYYSGITVEMNTSPNQPSNVSPANGATGVGRTPSLQSSAFSDPDSGDIHTASRWQIRIASGGYSSAVFDSGVDTSALTSIAIPSGTLSDATTYYWRVKHADSDGAWSAYSSETSFTTIGSVLPATSAYTHSISSTTGGSVASPGEGAFMCDPGTVVNLVATPARGYRFVGWSWCVPTIANVNVGSTTITMNGNYWIMANFEQIPS